MLPLFNKVNLIVNITAVFKVIGCIAMRDDLLKVIPLK